MHKILPALLVLAALGAPSALLGQEKDPFPSLQGWTLAVDSMVYTPDNLWNIIDGAADAYLLYGFVDLHTAEYLDPDSVDVHAELYEHSTAANAFGIYSQERKPEYRFIDIGTEGYTEDGVLNFLCGTYYVKLTSHTTGAKGLAALRSVAGALASHLDQPNGFPPQLALLPPRGKIRKSESYIADSYLGYSFFRSAYIAQYGSAGKTQLFVMEFDSPIAARETLKRYMEKLGRLSDGTKDGKYTLADPNNGTIGMLLKKQYLCGVVNCEDGSVRNSYLAEFQASLAKRPAAKPPKVSHH